MGKLIELPKTFFDDHSSGRGLPSPAIISETKRVYRVCAADPHLPELLSDAKHYSDVMTWGGADAIEYAGLQASARATVKAIKAATA